jgi:hypothetical protein
MMTILTYNNQAIWSLGIAVESNFPPFGLNDYRTCVHHRADFCSLRMSASQKECSNAGRIMS